MIAVSNNTALPAKPRPSMAMRATEIFFYIYLFLSGFAHLFFYIPNVLPVLLSMALFSCLLCEPARLRFALLPLLVTLMMFCIDMFVYTLDIETIKYYMFWAMMFAIFSTLHRDPGFESRCGLALLIYLLLHFFFLTKVPAHFMRLELSKELGGEISNANDLADWCGFGVLFSLIMCNRYGKILKVALYCSAGICILVLLGTVSRGALLVTAIAALLYYILNIRNFRKMLFLLLGLMFLAVTLLIFRSYVSDSIGHYSHRIHEASTRPALINKALDVLFSSPWVGTGINTVHPDFQRANSPHNFFLSITVHYGIFPGLAMVFLWLLTLQKLIGYKVSSQNQSKNFSRVDLFVWWGFLFMMANFSNMVMLHPFCTLYMSRMLTLGGKDG